MFNCILRLIEPYRSQKWRDAQEQKAFEAIFDDIPSDDDRKNMSEKELAEVLSTCKAGTPAYILVEHELNIRIAGIQSRATLRSGWLGLLSALLGAALGFFLGTLSPREGQAPFAQVSRCEYDNQNNWPVSPPKPTAAPPVVQGSTSSDVQRSAGNTKQKKSYAPANP